MTRLLVVRHVHAGDRATYVGDDRRRPASARGLDQAEALVDVLAGFPIVAIATSPLTRCVQSVAPLSAALGLVVEEVDEFAEGTPPDVVQRALRRRQRQALELGGDLVACSHGDVIGDLVHALVVRGVDLPARPSWPKAGTWVLDGDLGAALDGDAAALGASFLPPPA